MDRIKGGWLLLAASVLGLLFLTGALFPAKSLSQYSVDAETWNELCAGRKPADSELLAELTFNEYALWQDVVTGQYYYSLIENDPHAYDPQVTWRGNGGNVRLAVQETAITPESIAAGQPLHVMAYDDAYYSIREVSCTTLPLMSISFEDTGTQIDKEKWTGDDARIRLFDNRAQAARRLFEGIGVAHTRGKTTLTFPKKGYRLTLLEESLGGNLREYDASLLGMRQDGDWLLYAGYNDQEKIRNVFCCNLWKRSCAADNSFGISCGMEYRYVELFLDGEYWGLYALGYPIDAKQMQLKQDIAGDHQEFLFKHSMYLPQDEEVHPVEAFKEAFEMKFSAALPVQEKAWDLLANYDTVTRTGTDTVQIRQISDIANAIDVYLFLNLVNGRDNRGKNMYYTLKYNGKGYQTLYTPWDMDYSWGNTYDESWENNYTKQYYYDAESDFIFSTSTVPCLQALGDPEINEQVRQRYEELRSTAWSEEALFAMLDDLEEDIFLSGAFVRDKQRWPDGFYVDADQRLSVFKDYVSQRLRHIDDFVAALP